MNQPTADPAGTAAAAPPAGSVFIPQPPAPPVLPAPMPASSPDAGEVEHAAQTHLVLSRANRVTGRIDVLARRLEELLAGHAALIAHISDAAPVAGAPNVAQFWGQALDQHQEIHGLLNTIKNEALGVLAAHADLFEALGPLL